MFLRIEGFQVEIKEINKTWAHASFIKNFKIGEEMQNIKWKYSDNYKKEDSHAYTLFCSLMLHLTDCQLILLTF